MTKVKRLVLDVLKPHKPNVLELGRSLAALGPHYCVTIDVIDVDEQTENIVIRIEADDIDFESVDEAIAALGGSVHSIDGVEVVGAADDESAGV